VRITLRDWVTVLNATTTEDSFGNLIPNWGTATEAVEPAQVQPVTSDEVVVNEDTVEARWKVVLLPATVATALSRIEWRGNTFEVDGEVQPYTDNRGRIRHRSAYLKRVTG
jgi:head-tail adaptor